MGTTVDGLIFTGVDKALLDRGARILEGMAKDLESDCDGNWGASKATRKMKDEYDVLMRDARDLRALGKRMVGVAKDENRRLHQRLADETATKVSGDYVPAQAESVPQVRGQMIGVTVSGGTTS